ncbi:MAG: hypothetical protein SFU84_03280 [Gemmatimonadales bacterium]|nr:hypothetical protein [Gemmatimonadales bacterium]
MPRTMTTTPTAILSADTPDATADLAAFAELLEAEGAPTLRGLLALLTTSDLVACSMEALRQLGPSLQIHGLLAAELASRPADAFSLAPMTATR